jgi:4-hydroxysphinganine ceramide fatty acyl 2-hydroxylase
MTLPTIPLADIQTHTTAKSCYVTIGKKVYDVTDFIEDHPGGPELILDHAGTDVYKIMNDEKSHSHSETAYEILNDSLVGYLATDPVLEAATKSNHPNGVLPLPPSANGAKEIRQQENGTVYEATGIANADDLSKDTDLETDYKQHKFLDLNKPLLLQVWRGGFTKKFYLEQVHRPRHYKGGASAPLFGNFLEPLSLTPWWVVPTLWLPVITGVVVYASQGLPIYSSVGYFTFGLLFWTLIEYTLHRCLFHLDEYVQRQENME